MYLYRHYRVLVCTRAYFYLKTYTPPNLTPRRTAPGRRRCAHGVLNICPINRARSRRPPGDFTAVFLGRVRELSLQSPGFRADRIIPFAVEIVGCEVYGVHFGIGHLDARRISVLVEFATNPQTGLGRRCGDQLDDDLMADERFAAPVAGDERE